jgi:hypothetical protein
MSQTLILELSDEVYTTIQHQAESAGTSPAHWLAATLEQQYRSRHAGQSARRQRTAAEQHAARVHFERHFGEVDRPDAVGAGNEQIDADLAREYSDTHEAP